jgi:hypothetical protein
MKLCRRSRTDQSRFRFVQATGHVSSAMPGSMHVHRSTLAVFPLTIGTSSLPRDGGDDVRIFDWDCWRIDGAAGDFACMLALHWHPDRTPQGGAAVAKLPPLDASGERRGRLRSRGTDRRLSLGSSLAGSHTHSASDVEYPARFIDAPGARFGFV